MTTLTYRGYTAKVEVDLEDNILVGRILGINDVVGFHAETPKEIEAAFQEAVEDYLVSCEKAGKEPEKSYSGKMMFRVDPALHRQAAIAAEAANKSLNELGEEALKLYLTIDAPALCLNSASAVREYWTSGRSMTDLFSDSCNSKLPALPLLVGHNWADWLSRSSPLAFVTTPHRQRAGNGN